MNIRYTFFILALAQITSVAVLAAEARPQGDCKLPSADYVPGVDVYGKTVAPADADEHAAADLGTITVVPRIAVPNNRARDAQIVVDLKRSNSAPPNCPPTKIPQPKPKP